MTAKSEMVCNRLLRLSGERGTDSYKIRLLVAKLSIADPRKIIRSSRYPPRHYELIRNMFTVICSCMFAKSKEMHSIQTCISFSIKDLQMPFQKVPFYRAKGRLSHLKRAPFTLQKGIFYRVKVHLLFSMYESLLQPF